MTLTRFLVCTHVVFVLSIVIASQATAQVGSNYPPVDEQDLIGKQSSQRTGGDKFKFVWKFEKATFTIEGDSIPDHLQKELLGEVKEVKKIEGKWTLHEEELEFEVTRLDGMVVELPKRKLRTFNTGVTRIQTKAAQYVF